METALDNLRPLAEYQAQRSHIFPSASSLDWFVRQHRAELVKAGALLRLAGGSFADAPKFDECVSRIGQRKAAAKVST